MPAYHQFLDDFKCPISLRIMSDPVILSSGQTFDRASIQRWLDEGHRTCPITKLPLSENPTLIPNYALRSLISKFVSRPKPRPYPEPKNLIVKLTSVSSSLDSKLNSLDQLTKLSKRDSASRRKITESGAVSALLNCIGSSESPILQKRSLSLLLNLSLDNDNDNKVGLGEIGRVVEALFSGKHCQYWEEFLQQEISKQDSKNIEILNDLIREKSAENLNLQIALGGYTAEFETQKRQFEEQLAQAKGEVAKLSKLLEDANQLAEVSKREKEEILAKFSQVEEMLGEWKSRVHNLENRIATLNLLSMDYIKNYVDRRLVIKLLVTYFQRNHSNEVLDLMVRILQFSDEEKQRIDAAQKGVIRGVLGLPGRLVGGILGGGSAESVASENQSLAALWVDFLLKKTERERRDLEDDAG